MKETTALIITSIANDRHLVLREYAEKALEHGLHFIIVGDRKSPDSFHLDGCDYLSLAKQAELDFRLAPLLPENHYSRKNLGYLLAMREGADIIIETDDDNIPLPAFWEPREPTGLAREPSLRGWTNTYRYFSELNIWPRGFALERLHDPLSEVGAAVLVTCPIQQGLADENPDVDAIYRLTGSLPIHFRLEQAVALGDGSICPFNSQNTTWFKEAFPLLYLPSYCSFRMTDIWRSFIAQRIAWTCGWHVLFHASTVRQERNEHDLMRDFAEEVPGYQNNARIMSLLAALPLMPGSEHLQENLRSCYVLLIEAGVLDARELALVDAWLADLRSL
jgi:hypothetical protein